MEKDRVHQGKRQSQQRQRNQPHKRNDHKVSPQRQRTTAVETSMEKPKPILLKSHESLLVCCTNSQPLSWRKPFCQKDMGQSTLTQGTFLPFTGTLHGLSRTNSRGNPGFTSQFPSYFPRRQSWRVRFVLLHSFTQQRTKKDKLITNWISEHWTKRERERQRNVEQQSAIAKSRPNQGFSSSIAS